MGSGIRERRLEFAGCDERRPELLGEPELPPDFLGSRRVGGIGHVVEFARSRVAGAGVVPCGAALGGRAVETFEDEHRPLGLESAQERPQRRRHDSAADQYGVVGLRLRRPTGGVSLLHVYTCFPVEVLPECAAGNHSVQ